MGALDGRLARVAGSQSRGIWRVTTRAHHSGISWVLVVLSTLPAVVLLPTGAAAPSKLVHLSPLALNPTSTIARPQAIPSNLPPLPPPSPSRGQILSTGPAGVPSFTVHPPATQVIGPHPQSWGSLIPPGAPTFTPPRASGAPFAPIRGQDGSGSGNDNSRYCAGVWPAFGGQSVYANDCYGHDEPGIQFYSNLPGSGGNVTWTVTLPTDRSPTQNQSNLYVAIWFSMTLNDPYAWMNQCFLELQFYPDTSWYTPSASPYNPSFTSYGQWVGLAVAWQIQASTGFEDPCFISPLFAHGTYGPNFLNMSQGDRITVTMSGWPGDPWGENLSVVDRTNGNWTTVNLMNHTGAYDNLYNAFNHYITGTPLYPLDPSYVTNSFENGLQWTPGGEYPVGFAWETGHAGNPDFPSNSPFGGCSPGVPPPTLLNPSVPCPSYDPGFWTNDTVAPWWISVPTFSNGTTKVTPSQVGFTQDLGGIAYTAGNSIFGTFPFGCANQLGSAFCSYPWYSYSCATQSFTFGATDWPGVTNDFGKYFQFAQVPRFNGLSFGYYAPTNFSIPTCGVAGNTVTVGTTAGNGSVDFLSTWVTGTTAAGGSQAFPGVAPGTYSLGATGAPGWNFAGWVTTGAVAVDLPNSPWATLTVSGIGGVSARFITGIPHPTRVWLNDTAPTGEIVLNPGTGYNLGAPLGVFANGSSLVLAPGVYGIQALPPPGDNFTRWSWSGGGGLVSAPAFPYSLLVVTGTSSTLALTAHDPPSSATAFLVVVGIGNGTVTFNGLTVPYYASANESFATYSVPVGSYPVTAKAAIHWVFRDFTFGGNVVITVRHQSATAFQAEQAVFPNFDEIVALFEANATFVSVGGKIWVNGAALISGARLPFLPSWLVGPVPIAAQSDADSSFLYWLPTVNLSVADPFSPVTALFVNGPGTLRAVFATGQFANAVHFVSVPSSGSILFNFQPYANGQTNRSVANGTYFVAPIAPPGWVFTGWHTFGDIFAFGPVAAVFGPVSYLVAVFAPATYAVTFVSTTPGAVVGWVNSTPLLSGETVWLPAGSYPLAATVAGGSVALTWESTSLLTVASPSAASTTLTVSGPGTVYAMPTVSVQGLSLAPAVIDVGMSTTLSWSGWGLGALSYSVSGAGCAPPSAGATSTLCTPTAVGTNSVTVTATMAGGATVTSPPASVLVNALPSVVLSASSTAIDVGQAIVFMVESSGGTGALALSASGLPPGCVWSTGTSAACSPTTTGTFPVVMTATDSLGKTGSGNVTLTVNADPSITSVSATPNPATTLPVSLAVSIGGGTAPIAYLWFDLPAGCASSNLATISCAPSTPGTYTVGVTATDAAGKSAQAFVTFSYAPPAKPSSSASSSTSLNSTEVALAAVGIVLALIAIAVAILRRGPPTPPGPKPTPIEPVPPGPMTTEPAATGPMGSEAWREEGGMPPSGGPGG